MNLTATPGNAVPEGLVAREVRTGDGTRLRAALLRRPGSRGTVIIAPGRGDFIERYFETARDLAARNFSVAMLDFRGQGGSQRPYRDIYRSAVRSFAGYELDLEAVMKTMVLPDAPPPYFALGHSTGAHVLLRTLRRRTWFERAVLTAPLLGVDMSPWPVPLAKGLAKVLTACGLGRLFLPGHFKRPLIARGFEGNPLTSDRQRFRRDAAILDAAPGLGVGGPSFSWLRAAIASLEELERLDGMALRAPVLIVAAGRDRIVRSQAAREFAARVSGVSFIQIDEAMHEILCEAPAVRAQFFAAFDAFVG